MTSANSFLILDMKIHGVVKGLYALDMQPKCSEYVSKK